MIDDYIKNHNGIIFKTETKDRANDRVISKTVLKVEKVGNSYFLSSKNASSFFNGEEFLEEVKAWCYGFGSQEAFEKWSNVLKPVVLN